MPIIECERYEIEPMPIGKGGFGEVYKAYDLLYERTVVIKTIVAPRLYGINEPQIRRQFFKESVISARLGSHSENIVKVFDYGYDRSTDIPFFVMEYIQGYDLSRKIGKFSLRESFLLLFDMLTALKIAHDNGVVHSDISPDNIMFDESEKIYKLNDFGLARLLNSQLMKRGNTTSLVGGKAGFLPLLDWNTGNRSAHSDLYGLAVTITLLISGHVPLWSRSTDGLFIPPNIQKILENKLSSNSKQELLKIKEHLMQEFGIDETDIFPILLTKIINQELVSVNTTLDFMYQYGFRNHLKIEGEIMKAD